MDNDKIEGLIKEIAVKNGIAVGRDDPIMILHTINERLISDGQIAQKELLNQFKSELEEISHRWEKDSKNTAELILNASLAAAKESMKESMAEGSESIVEGVKDLIDKNTEIMESSFIRFRKLIVFNFVLLFLFSIILIFSNV